MFKGLDDISFFDHMILDVGVVALAYLLYSNIYTDTNSEILEPPITQLPTDGTYNYALSIAMTNNREWQYIEPKYNNVVLNNGDSISINIGIESKKPLDIVEIRFYNICNNYADGDSSIIYSYVDGYPAYPTIGRQPSPSPIYISSPRCPQYGTTVTTVWDTDDTRKSGVTNYKYVYNGVNKLTVKTLELYIATKEV